MKKLSTLLCTMLICFAVQAQTLLSEDFSSFTNDTMPPLASGWKNIDSLNSPPVRDSIWRFDNPGNRILNSPIVHPAAILDSDWLGAGNSQDAHLVSPPFDASTDSVVILEFDHFYNHFSGSMAEVQVFDSLSWQTVATYSANTTNPQHEVIDISSIAAGESYVQIRFHYTGSFDWYWIVDNIVVYQPVPEDIRLVTVDSLKNSCNLTATESITATFENISSDTLSSVPLNYRINGGSIVAETYSSQVLPNDIITYTFSTTADFSTVGNYNIEVFSTVRNDINLFNDTAYGTTINKPSLSTFPYFEDFESGAGNWADGGISSSWELGTPNGTVINSAASGSNAWITSLRGNYNNNEASYVVSPCFDFTSLTQPQIKMNIWVESENNYDGAVLQSTIDGGQTWQKVGAFGDPNNWYNDDQIFGLGNLEPSQEGWTGTTANIGTGAWVLAEHDLTGLAGEPSVELRIVFESDASLIEEGFAFDDVIIQEAPANDINTISVVQPISGCGLGSADSVKVSISNAGSTSASNFPIYFELNGATAIVDTVRTTLNPSDTITFTFNSTVNISTPGNYTFKVYSGLAGDGNFTNDTILTSFDNIPVINTLPYTEDFDAGPGGWTSYGTNSSWAHGAPSATFIPAAASASNAWVTNLGGDYNNSELSYLESPCFDFSSYNADPILYFSHIYETESCCDEGWIEYSIDLGASWTKLIDNGGAQEWYNDLGNQWWDNASSMGSGTWVNAENALIGLAGESNVKIRFVFSSDGSVTEEGFGVDDVSIQLPPPYNAKVLALESPVTSCNVTGSDSVKISFTNVGSVAFDTINLSYSFNSAALVTETYTDTVQPGDTVVYTFTSSTVNLATVGSYDFTILLNLTGDIDLTNDTIRNITVNSIPSINTFPYIENFESGTGGWSSYGANSSWAHGTPTGTYIPNAAGGNNAWVTNLSGDYNNDELSYLESPCLDFSSLTMDPILYFDHIYETESCCDEGWIEYSTDAGATWTKLIDNGNAQEWFNDLGNQWWDGNSSAGSGNWVYARDTLSGLAGESDVKIRFVFQSDFSVTNEGFGVDNILIQLPQANDAEISSVNSPVSSCGLGSNDSIRISFTNVGLSSYNSIDLSYRVNGGTLITETYNGTVNVNDTVNYTFNTTANFSSIGIYNIEAIVTLVGDNNPINDTILVQVENIPVISSLPYSEDFESGTGGWSSYGANSSWAHGTPTGTYIPNAAGGNNAWVTNLSGDYNNDELSYLESPCMDFSSLTADPILYFDHIYETESCCDEGWIEYSINAGASWTKLIDNGNAQEWFNDLGNQWWDGNSSAGSGNWVYARDTLSGLAGESDVKIRFVFQSDFSVTNEGFGVDNILVQLPTDYDASIVGLTAPNTQCGFSILGDTVKITVLNTGLQNLDTIPVGYKVGNTTVIDTAFTTLLPGDTLEFTFQTTTSLAVPGSYYFDVFVHVPNDGFIGNDSLFNIEVLNSQMVVPTIVDFDNLPTQQSGNFDNDWVGTSSDPDYQWYSNIGGTTSGSTGPDSDNTTGNGTFMYTEASSPAAQGDTAWLTSPCMDLVNSIDPALVFWYHMYGANIDTLSVQIDSMGTWVTIDTLIGQKHTATTDPYLSDTISLVNFNSLTNTTIRFQMVRGADYFGDVAIDDVELASIAVGLKKQKIDFSNQVVVYPNPTNNHINIEFNQTPKNKVELEIVNLVGKTIYMSETRKNIERIDMSGFAKGVYLLRMTNKDQTAIKRIVLQ